MAIVPARKQAPATRPGIRMKQRPVLSTLVLLLITALLGFSWLAWRAHRNLVTLNVRNMDVRKVARKIEWQTWEKVLVHKDVQGQVTLRVHKMPLEQVLRLVAEQTTSRSSVLYPLYSTGRSLSALTLALRGEGNAADSGWTNLMTRIGFPGGRWGGPGGPGGPGGGFGAPDNNNQAPRLSLEIQGKDVPFVVLAFDRYAQARVVPEDGTTALINLSLREAPVPSAVAQLAKKARRQWTTLYALQSWGPGPGRGGRGGPDFAMAGRGDPEASAIGAGPGAATPPPQRGPGDRERPGPGRPEMSEEQREEQRRQRTALEEELKQALPPEERQRVELAQVERERQMQEWQSLTPEQRRQRFDQSGSNPAMDTRNRQRLLNSTPEQRARMMGPGGPGRGGPPSR